VANLNARPFAMLFAVTRLTVVRLFAEVRSNLLGSTLFCN
jgi:hypothetical protein